MFALLLIAGAAAAAPQDGPRTPLALDLSGLNAGRVTPVIVAPVTPAAVEVAQTTYVARRGDTIRSAGEATGVGASALIRANGLAPPYVLTFGQTLIVPAGRYHRVREGDTGIAIARAYGVPWSRIVDANLISEAVGLRVGQRLLLPGSTGNNATARSIEQRAAAFQIGIDDLVTGTEPARAGRWTERTAAVPAPLPATTGTATRAFVWPASGRVVGAFGAQGRGRMNQGIDLAAAPGTAIRAAARGEVAYVGRGVPGFGGLILVRHDGGWISAYGRIGSAGVAKGARVTAGQAIGRTGTDDLHFQLRRSRIAVDPLRHLPRRG